MRRFLLPVLIVGIITVLGCHSVLDDSYDDAVDEAVRSASPPGKAEELRELLLGSMYSWDRHSSYGAVRSLVADLQGIQRQVRIEVGNTNAGTYRVAWIVETESSVVAYSDVLSRGKLRHATVSRGEWDKLLRTIAEQGELTRCKSDLAVDDGSSYFGTIAAGRSVQKFAVYGFIPLRSDPGTEELYQRLTPCSEVIKAIYSLLSSGR